MTVTAEPGEVAAAAAARAARALRVLLRVTVPLAVLGALLLLGAQLISARIPEQRATLQQLLREETGLEIRFEDLTVRWGWYGPEALFHHITLAAPGRPPLLRAARLGISLDLWRSARSGRFEAGRIMLLGPEIDVAVPARGSGHGAAPARPPWAEALARLEGWRGGRIDLWRGTLRLIAPDTAPQVLSLEHAELRRLGARWSADLHLSLPPGLGTSAHLRLELDEHAGNGTVLADGHQLNLAGWRGLAEAVGAPWPLSGEADLVLHATLAAGLLQGADAELSAQSLSWAAAASPGKIELPRLRGHWQLARAGEDWQLSAQRLDLGAGAQVQARMILGRDGLRGEARRVPFAALQALARGYGWSAEPVRTDAQVPRVTFEWNRARPPGSRLRADADLESLSLVDPDQDLALRGVRAHLAASEGELQVRLEATDARLAGGGAELAPLAVRAQLNVRARAQGWQLSAEDLELTQGESRLAGRFTLHGSPGQPVQLDGAATLRALELGPLASALAAHYRPLARLTEGRVERAAFEVHEALDGPLGPGRALGPRTGGTLELRELALAGAGTPALRGLDARLTLRGGELTALLRHGELQGFAIETGRVRWRPGAARGQLQARLRGRAEDALSWLRTQPALAAYAPGSDLEARGATRLELDLTGSPEELDLARSRLTALLEGVSLRPLAGVPALEGLRGTLRLRAGELRGSVNGRWLRGPATVTVSTRSLQGSSSVTLSGRGSADLREALPTSADGPPPLSGSTDWSAQLTLQPGAPDTAFVLRAEAPLTAVVSRLPDPLAKSAGSALPLHIQAQGGADAAQLRFGVGERLNGVLALERRDAQWRIARGAVLCGAGGAPVLPEAALLSVRGALPRLDLTAYLALWQQQARAPVLPPVSAELAAQALLLGPQAYPDSELTLTAGSAGGQLELRGPELAGSLSWPSQGDGVHRAQLRLARLTLAQPEQGLAAAAGLLELFGPTLRVDIGALRGAGDLLGAVGATVSRRADELLIEDLLWQGPQLQGSGRAQCALRGGGCALNLHLASHDLATTLATLGWRPDLTAPRARLEGELHWAHSAPLATLGGHLHMQIESGQARASEVGAPFPLFVVPALLSALEPQAEDSAARVLPFQSLSADFDLERGIARTTNMHLDGEAEILVRGRVGLASGDYDSEALILRGEDRLPQPMRRLAATPRIAALWLALRGWLAGEGHGRAPPTLYLRGPWQDPTVTPAE